MTFEFGLDSTTVAHKSPGGTTGPHAPKKKAPTARKSRRGGGSTQAMAADIRMAKAGTKKGSSARKGMIKSIRRKQAKKANYQHEG
jgi:hypothetical protein